MLTPTDDFDLVSDGTQDSKIVEEREIIETGKERIRELFKNITCYEVIPQSGKIVVLDTGLAVKSAFQALVENDIKSAPLWDAEVQDFVGMITVTDFINILLHFHYNKNPSQQYMHQELQEHKIKTWRDILGKDVSKALMFAEPDMELYTVTLLMTKSRIHRVPLIDKSENLILHIITHTRVLKYLMSHIGEKPELFHLPIRKLGIGTWKNIITVKPNTSLLEVLDILSEHSLSSVPIIDENDVLVDVYSKSDVPALVVNRKYDELHRSIKEVIADWRSTPRLAICRPEDSIETILNHLFDRRAHRLICVDEKFRILGIVSMSDILQFFVLD